MSQSPVHWHGRIVFADLLPSFVVYNSPWAFSWLGFQQQIALNLLQMLDLCFSGVLAAMLNLTPLLFITIFARDPAFSSLR